ncbi:hypothetical protein [Abyssalbus ytuae]|uniref:Uncharacterized protein n=1 Tax=Abyssalbus ytuae TaxID=2926907 RepID=A0A9E7D0H6_9FLAO|nr:hypothetical protein [Abyssalbus ytuae]UOB18430.1 hypothetical protein MQE35_03860 [Abyssalbus ytuae]
MKTTKILIMLLISSICFGQSHSESIADVMVASQKMMLYGLLKREKNLLREQQNLIEKIKKEEKSYQDKIGPLSNISNTIVFLTLEKTLRSMKKKISNVETNIRIRKFATFGLRHGLSRYESELKRLKKYFNKLEEEQQVINTVALASGGAGYNYTATLKLLLRAIKVRGKILEIDKNVKALMGASRLFAK